MLCTMSAGRDMGMKKTAVLTSRWGLKPVVVFSDIDSEDWGSRRALEEANGGTLVSRTSTEHVAPSTAAETPTVAEATAAAAAMVETATGTLEATGGTALNTSVNSNMGPYAYGDGEEHPSDPDVDENEDEDECDDEPTGRTLWDCARVLWDLVADPNPRNAFSVKGKHVIELGAGTGALSVGLARAGAHSVTCTDLPCHLPRIESTIRANSSSSSRSFCFHGPPESRSSIGGIGGGSNAGAARGETDRGSGENGVLRAAENHEKVPEKLAVVQAVAPVVAREAGIRVEALRWGKEEDISRVCKRVDNQGGGGGKTVNAREYGSCKTSSASCRDGVVSCTRTTTAETCVVDETTAAPPSGTGDSDRTGTNKVESTPDGPHRTGDFGPPCGEERGRNDCDGGVGAQEVEAAVAAAAAAAMVAEGYRDSSPPSSQDRPFDVVVLSEVLYWPALDLLQEDTRKPLLHTLMGLSKPGTKVILIYKERWLEREEEFLESCEGSFEVETIPPSLLTLPTCTTEDPDSSAIRAVLMIRRLTE